MAGTPSKARGVVVHLRQFTSNSALAQLRQVRATHGCGSAQYRQALEQACGQMIERIERRRAGARGGR